MAEAWHDFFTRRRLRFGLAVLLVLAVGGVGVQLVRSQWAQYLRRLGTKELDFLPQVAQRIQNFRRVKMDGERKVWEVAAREAQYFEDEHEIVVEEPEVSLFLADDEGVVSLRGSRGKILLDGREMERVELEGGIEVRFRDYLVTTERVVYERASDALLTPGAVKVTSGGFTLNGGRMTMEVAAQRVRLDGSVETVLRGPAESEHAG